MDGSSRSARSVEVIAHEHVSRTAATAPETPKTGGIAERKKTLLILGRAAIWSCCFGVRYILWSAHHETRDDAYLAGHLHPISARITDTVQQVLIDDNQHVVEGQILVILDPNDYKVGLDQAKAALDAASRRADTDCFLVLAAYCSQVELLCSL
jgi:membrane fusion protein (multidrug efflux system)